MINHLLFYFLKWQFAYFEVLTWYRAVKNLIFSIFVKDPNVAGVFYASHLDLTRDFAHRP